jgi:hypothetical protein
LKTYTIQAPGSSSKQEFFMKMTAQNRVMQMHLPAEFVLPAPSISILTISLSTIVILLYRKILGKSRYIIK